MKRLAASLILACLSIAGWSQSVPISGQVVDTNGVPVDGALVRVCSVTSSGTPCNPSSNIFYDYNLSSPAPNTFSADQYGNFLFYAGVGSFPNMYLVQVSPDKGVTWYSYVHEGPAFQYSGGTITGNLTVTGNGSFGGNLSVTGTITTSTGFYGDGSHITNIPSGSITGILPIANGGTGSGTAAGAMANLLAPCLTSSVVMFNGTAMTCGVVSPALGGTGATTPTGYAYGNGASAFSFSTTIPYSVLTGTPTIPTSANWPGAGSCSFAVSALNNGAAPSCVSLPTIYYQTVYNGAGTAMTQVAGLKFTNQFSLTNGTGVTQVDLGSVGTLGTYGNPVSITTDAYGRVTSVTASSYTSRTCNGSGCYAIAADGTITQWISTGTLNNNTPTTISLPHSVPSVIMSITCTDNSSRVQTGNNQPVGANISGLTAPYSTFYADAPATGMSAYCTVVGY